MRDAAPIFLSQFYQVLGASGVSSPSSLRTVAHVVCPCVQLALLQQILLKLYTL